MQLQNFIKYQGPQKYQNTSQFFTRNDSINIIISKYSTLLAETWNPGGYCFYSFHTGDYLWL